MRPNEQQQLHSFWSAKMSVKWSVLSCCISDLGIIFYGLGLTFSPTPLELVSLRLLLGLETVLELKPD